MKRPIYVLVGGLLLASSVAHAEMIQGRIVGMDPVNNILNITRTDNFTGTSQQVNVQVKNDTQTKNVASLKELRLGQEVKIDAQENKTSGIWEAKSVETTPVVSSQSTGQTTGQTNNY